MITLFTATLLHFRFAVRPCNRPFNPSDLIRTLISDNMNKRVTAALGGRNNTDSLVLMLALVANGQATRDLGSKKRKAPYIENNCADSEAIQAGGAWRIKYAYPAGPMSHFPG